MTDHVYWQPLCREHQRLVFAWVRDEEKERLWRDASNGRVVYFARRRDAIKIGSSSRLSERLRTLARGSDSTLRPDQDSGPVDLLAWVRGDIGDEHNFQAAMPERSHLVGEWFTASDAVLEEIDYQITTHASRHQLAIETEYTTEWPARCDGHMGSLLAERRWRDGIDEERAS